MLSKWLRPLLARLYLVFRYLVRTQAVWLRAIVCFAVGLSFLYLESSDNFDTRFSIRGPQAVSKSIVIIHLGQQEWLDYHGKSRNILRGLKEISAIGDNFFWNPTTWNEFLEHIMKDDPRSIGVTFFFDSSLQPEHNQQNLSLLQNNKVIWAAEVDQDGRARLPALASNYALNVGLIQLSADDDRIVRKFSSPLVQVPHLAAKVSGMESSLIAGESHMINYRGRSNAFEHVSFRDVMDNRLPAGFFKNKIVLIGSIDLDGHIQRTPLGEMSRAEVAAQVVDNLLANRWIQFPNFWLLAIYLLILLLLAMLVLNTYPQEVAFIILLWLILVITALSLWMFDSFYIWIPMLSPIAELSITYILMLGYQLSEKENLTWRLEQEKRLLFETEQQKSHFLSLMSHDLKTPIAKIQAICDRVMSESKEAHLNSDLVSIKKESMELNRYIQTMLQVSRVESGTFKFRKEATDLNEVIENVYNQVLPLAKQKKISMSLNLEPLFSIEIDSILIQEVILNLVENAVKYTPEEGSIHIRSTEVDDWVSVQVEDTGPGISEEERSKVFEKFYRGETQRMTTKGSGLGLFLVKYFIELHGGRVKLKSQKGKGTQIGFDLPLGALS